MIAVLAILERKNWGSDGWVASPGTIVADIEDDMATQRQTVLAYPHLGEFDLRDNPAE